MPIFRNLEGTTENSFQIGSSNGPLLERVLSTARLRLSNLLRWLPNGSVQQGFVAAGASGDLYVSQNNLTATNSPTSANDNTQGYSVGSFWLDITNSTAWICRSNATGSAVWLLISPPTPVFGSFYNYAESLSLSTTTSNSFITKLTLNLTSIPPGTYRISWMYMWNLSSTSQDFLGRVQFDGVTQQEHQQEPKDAGSDQLHSASGFFQVVLGSTADHTITIQYRSQFGATARIQDARLEFQRVA